VRLQLVQCLAVGVNAIVQRLERLLAATDAEWQA
jgi:hypothetical protein